MEVGLGYGTLGQLLATRSAKYCGVDIALAPVKLMQYRLRNLGFTSSGRVQQASVLNLPYKDGVFDYVYSIGCIHHTGNINRAISEIYRVLVAGGRCIIMLYNRHSFRRFVYPLLFLFHRLLYRNNKYSTHSEHIRALYDIDDKGCAAPYTEFVSRTDIRSLFRRFSWFRIDCQNFDECRFPGTRLKIPRKLLLNNFGRIVGLDFYIVAEK